MNLADSSTLGSIDESLRKLDVWIEEERFAGWEPHDALNSPILKRLVLGNRTLSTACVQALRRSPVNLRPVLGISKGYNPKAMGLFLASYSQRFLINRDPVCLGRIHFFADWLKEHAIHGYSGPCWGYNFDWPNRAFFARAGTPTIVNTAFIAMSFLAADLALENAESVRLAHGYRKNGVRSSDFDALSIARGACEFVLRDLNALRPGPDELCFSYTPHDRRFVHNASLMGACLLAAVYRRTGDGRLGEDAKAAARFTTRRQQRDGSWAYGLEKRDKWVDNFHTGFVLLALREIARCLDTDEFEDAAKTGYRFWKERMLLEGYIPKYYPNQTYPIDVHCVAQAVLTFLEFSNVDPEATSNAARLCTWAIENLQDPLGFFHYQIHQFYRVRIPYMRWGQAWMHLALTKFVLALRGVTHNSTASLV